MCDLRNTCGLARYFARVLPRALPYAVHRAYKHALRRCAFELLTLDMLMPQMRDIPAHLTLTIDFLRTAADLLTKGRCRRAASGRRGDRQEIAK